MKVVFALLSLVMCTASLSEAERDAVYEQLNQALNGATLSGAVMRGERAEAERDAALARCAELEIALGEIRGNVITAWEILGRHAAAEGNHVVNSDVITAEPLWWYLSFCDTKLPKRSQFLGGAYVDAPDFPCAVIGRAWELGCNPGGEVEIVGPLPDELMDEAVPESDRRRLLTRKEINVPDLDLDALAKTVRMALSYEHPVVWFSIRPDNLAELIALARRGQEVDNDRGVDKPHRI